MSTLEFLLALWGTALMALALSFYIAVLNAESVLPRRFDTFLDRYLVGTIHTLVFTVFTLTIVLVWYAALN